MNNTRPLTSIASDSIWTDQRGQDVLQAFLQSPYLSNKHSSYFQTYADLFQTYLNRPITFVEIGVFSGGSLFMWQRFFGPQARIIGVEFNPEAVRWREHGFEIFIGSQSDPSFWRDFFDTVGNVDLVLDDGGHTYEQQICTVDSCLPHIKDGGLIVVEDTHTSYQKAFGYPSKFSFMEWAKSLVDQLNQRSSVVEKRLTRTYEKSISSIEFFESIVAFKVDRRKCNPCHPVSNNQKSVDPIDFRFKDYEEQLWWIPQSIQHKKWGLSL